MLWRTKSRNWSCLAIPALVILATVWLFPVPGFSNTYNISPTADAAVFSSSPTNNYGHDTGFYVFRMGATTLQYAYSYLKFDLSSIPASERITGGSLFAYCNYKSSGTAITIQLRPVDDTTWSETGITWNNKPAYGTLITSTAGNIGWDHWTIPAANLPVTGLVSFMLMPATSGEADLYSKESPSGRPYLQVTTEKKPQSPTANSLLLFDD